MNVLDQDALSQRREELTAELAQLEARRSLLDQQISDCCQKLGLSQVPSEEELNALIAEAEGKMAETQKALDDSRADAERWEAHLRSMTSGGVQSSVELGGVQSQDIFKEDDLS